MKYGALAIVAAWVVARSLGLADHVSVVAGMPPSESSWILGPLYVVLTILAAVVAPILALAALLVRLVRRTANAQLTRQ